MRARQRGVTLLEMLVALAIFSVIVIALMQMQRQLSKGTQVALDINAIGRALYLVQDDIIKNDRYLPPQEFPAAASPIDAQTLDPFLDNANISSIKCYSQVGLAVDPTNATPDCRNNPVTYFRITYAKFRQPDVSFYVNGANPAAAVGNDLNRIPIGHYRMRVDYAPDANRNLTKRMYFSRYVTSTIVN